MVLRRSRRSLSMAALAVVVVCGMARTGGDRTLVRVGLGGRAVAVQSPWSDWVTVGINGVDRRESGREGPDKQRLVLLAVAAQLLYLAALGRGVNLFAVTMRPSVPFGSRRGARAPPAFAV